LAITHINHFPFRFVSYAALWNIPCCSRCLSSWRTHLIECFNTTAIAFQILAIYRVIIVVRNRPVIVRSALIFVSICGQFSWFNNCAFFLRRRQITFSIVSIVIVIGIVALHRLKTRIFIPRLIINHRWTCYDYSNSSLLSTWFNEAKWLFLTWRRWRSLIHSNTMKVFEWFGNIISIYGSLLCVIHENSR